MKTCTRKTRKFTQKLHLLHKIIRHNHNVKWSHDSLFRKKDSLGGICENSTTVLNEHNCIYSQKFLIGWSQICKEYQMFQRCQKYISSLWQSVFLNECRVQKLPYNSHNNFCNAMWSWFRGVDTFYGVNLD